MEMEQENPDANNNKGKPSNMKNKVLILLLVLSLSVNLALIIVVVIAHTSNKQLRHVTEAVCHVRANPSPKLDTAIRDANPIQGTVKLVQKVGDSLSVSLELSGFKNESTSKKHGFHVHQSGDIFTDGCQSAKGHFNPEKKKHGNIDDTERHVGDWGNIVVPANGNIATTFTDSLATLTGKYGVLGRAIVIHQLEDDLGKGGNEGSMKTGNAGKRLACCVIVPEK